MRPVTSEHHKKANILCSTLELIPNTLTVNFSQLNTLGFTMQKVVRLYEYHEDTHSQVVALKLGKTYRLVSSDEFADLEVVKSRN